MEVISSVGSKNNIIICNVVSFILFPKKLSNLFFTYNAMVIFCLYVDQIKEFLMLEYQIFVLEI